jgi:hypothetical protein
VSYTEREARQQLLAEVGQAAAQIDIARAALGEVYEWLDEQTADRLEEELFRPANSAYGRAHRIQGEFAQRYGVPSAPVAAATPAGRPGDSRGAIERAAAAMAEADHVLATLQDSMLPVDVGDPELRRGLSEVRELIAPVPERARQLLRMLGR